VRQSGFDAVFESIIYAALTFVAVTMIYPFLNVFAIAFSDYTAFIENPMRIVPKNFTVSSFTYVMTNSLILSSYRNTLIITVVGTIIAVGITITTAYPLARRGMRGKKFFMNMIIITMLFSGGLIPEFYLIRSLGLIDNLWALILPPLLSAYNVILMKNFFQSIPDSLEEAARIDGASDLVILTRIFIPLSTAIIATISLFVAVGYWNSFFLAVIYIRDQGKWTLQLLLREIISMANTALLNSGGNMAEVNVESLPRETIKYATLIVVMVPILCVYPFLQRYFVKGTMIGAVKG
jgi:putative aldouronate transport system permease protein